jgi:L-alanine-DL-glutamate epimerase-like enolase superfamily enzyme
MIVQLAAALMTDLEEAHRRERITGFRAWSVALPLRRRLYHATADVSALTSVLVEVELSDGVRGHAEVRSNGAYATGEDEAAIAAALRTVPAKGKAIDDLGDELLGRSVLAAMAVDIALWDAIARRSGLPLYRAWNPAAAEAGSVRTHAQIGFGDVDTAVDLARSFVAVGFDRLKIRVGAADPQYDVARVRAIRRAVGPEVAFVIDVNGSWTYDTAAEGIDALADLGVAWIEQPAMSVGDLARLRRHAAVPVYADESVRGPESVGDLVEADAVDGVHLKLEKSGTAALLFQTAALARANGLKVALGQMDQGQLGCAVTTHLAVALGLERAELWGWAEVARDLADTMVMRSGRVAVPVGAGNGIDSIDTAFAQEIL